MNEFRVISLEQAQERRLRAPMLGLRLGMIAGGEKSCELSLSVVAPCYNEALGLAEFHRRVSSACGNVGAEYEIVLVNDGSRDNTWSVMSQLAADPHVVAINLARNYGHQIALTAGLQFTRGERVLIIDADLQDPPELLGNMMQRMDEGADVVYGQREIRQGEGWFKRMTASLFYRILVQLVEIDIPRDAGDFRLLSRRALEVLNTMPEHDRFIRGMVSWIGLRQVPVHYVRAPRFAGGSNYPFRKMLRFAVDAITGFSTRPLRLASYLGGALGVIGLASMIYIIAGFVLGHVVQGWASVMTAVVLLSSCNLIMLGIIDKRQGPRLVLVLKHFTQHLLACAEIAEESIQKFRCRAPIQRRHIAEVLTTLARPRQLRQVERDQRAAGRCRCFQQHGLARGALTSLEHAELVRCACLGGVLQTKFRRGIWDRESSGFLCPEKHLGVYLARPATSRSISSWS